MAHRGGGDEVFFGGGADVFFPVKKGRKLYYIWNSQYIKRFRKIGI